MKPGNRVEDKTLKIRKNIVIVRTLWMENPSHDDGMIDPTLSRYDSISSLNIPDIVTGMWKAVDERRR